MRRNLRWQRPQAVPTTFAAGVSFIPHSLPDNMRKVIDGFADRAITAGNGTSGVGMKCASGELNSEDSRCATAAALFVLRNAKRAVARGWRQPDVAVEVNN